MYHPQRKNDAVAEPHLRVDDLLGDVVEVVPAIISPQPGVEGGGQPTKLPLGAAIRMIRCITYWVLLSVLELQTKVMRRVAKISQSWRRPLSVL